MGKGIKHVKTETYWCEQCGREISKDEVEAGDVYEMYLGRLRLLSSKNILDHLCVQCYLKYVDAMAPLLNVQKYSHQIAEEGTEGGVSEQEVDNFFDNLKGDETIFTEGEDGLGEPL